LVTRVRSHGEFQEEWRDVQRRAGSGGPEGGSDVREPGRERAFLIPFLAMLFITGIPLVFMEMSFGQFASSGVVSIWSVCPLFQGVGWAMFVVSVLIAIYYNMIIAWTLYYLFASFAETLPWSICGPWSSEGCFEDRAGISNCTHHGGVWYNDTCVTNSSVGPDLFLQIQNITNMSEISHHSPSDDYFHNVVLDITGGVYHMGELRWQLALCLLLAWPRALRRPARDSILVSILDCLTSVFAGLVIFSIIGYMAHELHQGVKDVATEGAGLAFVVYPEVVTKLPISQLWAILFFAMLITLGLGTQIATVTTVHTTLLDQFPRLLRKGRRSVYLLLVLALACYLIGLAFCSQGGMYVLQLFDNYAATYSLLFIGLVECVVLSWVYGTERFFDDIQLMLGKRPGKIWSISWKFIAPAALTVILIFTCVNFNPTTYGGYTFPGWSDGVGLLLTLSSILAIPGVAVLKVVTEQRTNGGTLLQCARRLTKPQPEWGPALKEHRIQKAAVDGLDPSTFESQVPLTISSTNGGQTPLGNLPATKI
ncbi:hypothetical protein BaRGS_00038499, partial [Batillaria attramentaria]